MKYCNQNTSYRQPSIPSEASSVKSYLTTKSYLTVSPKQRNQLIRSAFKVFQEMQEEMYLNKFCKLSLRFEQIHLLLSTQKQFMLLNKMHESYNRQIKLEAFQQIVRFGAIDYSNSSSIFKTPQRSHSPGIVSKDIGMEKNIQNQQLIKIIQELQSQIAAKELCKTIYIMEEKVLRDSLQQIKQQIKLSQKLEKILLISEISMKRQSFHILKVNTQKIKKMETGIFLLSFKMEKLMLNYIYHFYYMLKIQEIKNQFTNKQQIQIKLNGYSILDINNNIKVFKLYNVFLKYCYRQPFNQLKKNYYSYNQQIDLNQRNSSSIQRFSLGQLSQTQSQQVSQVLVNPENIEKQEYEQQYEYEQEQDFVLSSPQIQDEDKPKLKSETKQNGKLAKSIKSFLSQYEEQRQQNQQMKIELFQKNQKKIIQEEKEIEKQKNSKIYLYVLAIVMFFIILSYSLLF